MTDEEIEISRSTPGQRFDTPAPAVVSNGAATVAVPAAVETCAAGTAYVDEVVNDRTQPVVLFALEWCEFCWSVRRLFARIGLAYRSIDLDSVAMQRDDLGGRVRRALAARTGISTIPQLFVGGTLVGGCTDTLDAWRDGRLQRLLREAGTSYDSDARVDASSFLPGWLQPR
jgi:cysteine synthase A